MVISMKNVPQKWGHENCQNNHGNRPREGCSKTDTNRDLLSNFDPILRVSFTCEHYLSVSKHCGDNFIIVLHSQQQKRAPTTTNQQNVIPTTTTKWVIPTN